ncbi:hypothetical protein QUA83_15210 [Microcoleus sp. K1-B1]
MEEVRSPLDLDVLKFEKTSKSNGDRSPQALPLQDLAFPWLP